MYLKSLEGCRLAIGSYPPFEYDARGGGGKAKLLPKTKDDFLHLRFIPETFSIPPLTWRTTKFLSLPLPPGLKIDITMDQLDGKIDKNSGKIELELKARFVFSIGYIFHFPDLIIKTALQTGRVKSGLHDEEGLSRQNNGRTTLVGVAIIPATGNKVLDLFLNLPNEALAVLQCEIN